MDPLWSADHSLDLPRQPAKTTTCHQQSYGNYDDDDDDDDRDDNNDGDDDNINESVTMPIAVTMMMEMMMFSIVVVTHFLPEAIRLAARSGSSSTSRLTSLGAVVSTTVKS